jgi:pimeloyl-ACP methyl ester carboxylesterase
MKNFYLWLVLVLTSLSVRAQITDPTRAALDNLFAPLDKSQVPTGRLAEFATPLVPLDIFNGTLTDSSRTTPDGFRYIYATLYSAQVSGTALPSLANLNSRIATTEAQVGPNSIPLLIQRVDYASVRADAFTNNLLKYQNGQVSDVAGRNQSPYQTRTLFAAAPTRAHAYLGKAAFYLPLSLYTQSGGGGINGQYVDCGDGQGYQTTSWGQAVVGNYSAAGTKRVKVRFTYADGSSYESHFDVEIVAVDNSTVASAGGNQPLGALDFRVEPIAGVRGGGSISVTLGSNHTAITKPFIVAEGYDPSNTISLFVDNYSATTFLDAINLPTSNFFFKAQLLNAGYDIIFIDYDDGTDDILLNAALFKEVVSQVNTRKAGTERNVVLGISMGGLVARYGLADMEKSTPGSTQTRLLILQDSPQRGANTPLGLQALVRQSYVNFGSFTLYDVNKALAQLNSLIDRPASQQLLLYRATDASSGCAINTFLDNTYRPKVTFTSGQNPPYQIIAASNGSQCGTALFAPYAELARGDANIFLSPFPWIIRTSYYAQVIVNAIPANGQANRLSTLQLYSIIRLFGFINIRTNFVREDYNCPAGLLAVDGVAGGTQYLGRRLPSGLPTTAGAG